MKLLIQFDKGFDFFLSRQHQGNAIDHVLSRRASVKDIIESLGVPHTEVGNISFDSKQIRFSFIPDTSGRLNVEEFTKPVNVLAPSYLRPEPLHAIRFVADVNVIKLARLMILMGFNVAYDRTLDDQTIADIAVRDQRIVLTRDTRLLNRAKIIYARRIRSNLPYQQLSEVVRFFGLERRCSFFSRCTHCNRALARVKKEDVIDRLEPKTKKYFNRFYQCPSCERIYWKGSHYDRMQQKMELTGLPIHC